MRGFHEDRVFITEKTPRYQVGLFKGKYSMKYANLFTIFKIVSGLDTNLSWKAPCAQCHVNDTEC